MSGPWEKYAQPAAGPWAKYAQTPGVSDAKPTDVNMPSWLQQMAADNPRDPTANMSGMERFTAAAGAVVPEMAMGVKQAFGAVDQATVNEHKAIMRPLEGTTSGKAGKIVGSVAAAAPAMFVPGANTVAGSAVTGALMGAAQPTSEGESRALNATLGAAGGAAGQWVGGKIAEKVASKIAKGAAAKAEGAVRDATLKAGQEAGYVVAPANANPSAWNRLLQGLAGKTATGQRAAMLNQTTTNKLVRQALGMAEDSPITPEALGAIRAEAGKAYETLRAVPEIALDGQYVDDITRAVEPYEALRREFPEEANKEIEKVIGMAMRDRVSGNGLIAATRSLREEASAAFKAGDAMRGRIMRGVSDAMESAAERHLAQAGDSSALGAFKAARQLIAKTHTVEDSINQGTGNVVASKLAAALRRGEPLSGELKQVGKFSQAFPRETQEVANSSWLQMPGPSPLDWTAGAAAAVGTGNPAGLALTAARPIANAILTSKPYQRLFTSPSYGPGKAVQAIGKAAGSKGGKLASRTLAALAALGIPTDREEALQPSFRHAR